MNLTQSEHCRAYELARWHAWTLYAAAAGILTIVFIAAFGSTIAHGPAGLFERLASGTQSLWGVVLVARLLAGTGRVATEEHLP